MFGEYARMLEARTYDGDTLSRTYPRRLYAALMPARDTVST